MPLMTKRKRKTSSDRDSEATGKNEQDQDVLQPPPRKKRSVKTKNTTVTTEVTDNDASKLLQQRENEEDRTQRHAILPPIKIGPSSTAVDSADTLTKANGVRARYTKVSANANTKYPILEIPAIESVESTAIPTPPSAAENSNTKIVDICKKHEEEEGKEDSDDEEYTKVENNPSRFIHYTWLSSTEDHNHNDSSYEPNLLNRLGFFRCLVLYLSSLFIIILTINDLHVQNVKEVSIKANTIILQKRNEINDIKLLQSKTALKLGDRIQSLESTQGELKQCTQTSERIQNDLNSLVEKSNGLTIQLEESNVKIQAMAGSEEDIRYSLTEAWAEINSLQNQTNHLIEINTIYNNTANALSSEKEKVENRMIELEFELVEADDKLKSLQQSYDEEIASREEVESKLQKVKELVDQLEDELDKEDGRAWYYQLQIRHLEGLIDDRDTSISDLEMWNNKLTQENEKLKVSLDLQVREAVSALNAVAKSATVRKAKEFKEREHNIVQIEKDRSKNEASNAVESVVSAVKLNSTRAEDIDDISLERAS